MSKEVYSIDDQNKFNVGMAVGHMCGHNGIFAKEAKDWTYDVEFAGLAKVIYDKANGDYSTNNLKMLIKAYFSGNYTRNGLCRDDLPHLEDWETDDKYRDYMDFWYGTECGDFYGFANKKSLAKANRIMGKFMDQMHYGFVHEVIEDLDGIYT